MTGRTYEEAARDYLAKFSELMQQPLDINAVTGQGEMPAEFVAKRAKEIAAISTSMLGLAGVYLDSGDPAVREGISGHFIDQASAELLLGTEWMQRTGTGEIAPAPLAAERATQNAALREAINAVEKSTSIPIAQGLPVSAWYRITESANPDEAAVELAAVVMNTSSSILNRVQELASEIAFDLVQGTEWDKVARGSGLSDGDIVEFCADALNPAGQIVLTAYRKIAALLEKEKRAEMFDALPQWLHQIKQSHEIRFSDALLQKACPPASIQTGIQKSGAARALINQTSDRVKTISDRFIVLVGRMRKLEDAIRLSKVIRIPQWSLTMVALQVMLLASLICTGRQYVQAVEEILRDRGFLN